MVLGERIKHLRQQRWWSQMRLSKKLNTHQKQISGYERGIHVGRGTSYILSISPLVISSASLWEIAIKTSLGKLELLGN